MNYVLEIKKRLKMPVVAEYYGLKPNRQNRIPCPFHGGKNPNLGLKEDFCHCFKCGYKADVIKFVQDYFGISFQDALRKIDADFCLQIYGEHSFEDLRRFHYEQKAFEAKQQREKIEKQKLEDEYWAAFDEWKRLDDNRRIFAPKSTSECLHPLFVESLLKLDHQRYILDCLEARNLA